MASSTPTEFSSYPIISEHVTDLVHCPICSHILWKPVTCSLCENPFCLQCIQIWLFEQQEPIIEDVYNANEITRCPFNCSPLLLSYSVIIK